MLNRQHEESEHAVVYNIVRHMKGIIGVTPWLDNLFRREKPVRLPRHTAKSPLL